MAVQRLSMDRGSLVVALFLMVALFATGSHGQTAPISAPALSTTPRGNVFVTYFGDTQNTTAIGAGRTLPQCSGTFAGQSNLILKLENSNTGLVLQQVGPFTSQNFILWDTAANATLTPSLTGSYVCRLYQNSILVATSGFSYQLNVVVSMRIACQYPTFLNYESMNVISCSVTGYPKPMFSWIGVNGATTTTTPATLSGGIYSITSTLSFVGNQAVSAPGLNATVDFTAEYVVPFNCTTIQDETIQANLCESIPDTVTEPLRPLVVAQCAPVNNPAFNSTPSMAMNYTSSFIFGCATNYTIPGSPDIIPSICQANGIWSPLPNCPLHPCLNTTTCKASGSTCSVTVAGITVCTCPENTTGDGRTANGCASTTPPPPPPEDSLPDWVIPVAVVGGIVLIVIVIVIVLLLVKSKNNRKTPDTEPLPQASPKSKPAAETEDQYDTFVRNDGRQPQPVADPSADPDHYDTFHHPDQQEPGTGPSARSDTYDHIVLNKSIPAEGETYDHLDRKQVQAIKQGQQPGQQSAAATALSTQQAGNPRVDTSYSMVDMSKKSSRPLLV